jgi:hypothetical protein
MLCWHTAKVADVFSDLNCYITDRANPILTRLPRCTDRLKSVYVTGSKITRSNGRHEAKSLNLWQVLNLSESLRVPRTGTPLACICT